MRRNSVTLSLSLFCDHVAFPFCTTSFSSGQLTYRWVLLGKGRGKVPGLGQTEFYSELKSMSCQGWANQAVQGNVGGDAEFTIIFAYQTAS
jgi:hypothetical protein